MQRANIQGNGARLIAQRVSDDGTSTSVNGAPIEMVFYPNPVFDGDNVWAVVRDELDVEYVTRFRVTREPLDNSAEE